ncbi:MAG: TetR/AcrR family transcriptional regulator [Proteobacteria bacterium]|nr:TetR/AcrR family transcriptional regulator [Pseudomonadota bacterium]
MRDGSQTRKKLERCALALFVKKGVSATTIKDIAHKAQIAEGTLYRHYVSKDELAQHLFTSAYEEMTQALKNIAQEKPTLKEKMHAMVHYFCEKFDEDPILFNYLLIAQHNQLKTIVDNEKNAHEFMVAIFNDAFKKKEIPKRDPNFCAAIVLGIVLQAAISRVYGRITDTMVSDADQLVVAIQGALNF